MGTAPLRVGCEPVLLVDDDALVRRVAKRVLTGAGFEVVEAGTGEEAVELVRAGGTFACAVIDVTMPGLDGPACAEALRTMEPRLPVLFCSGFSADVTIAEACDDRTSYLAKPYRQRELVDGVERLLAAGA
jgi:CheY-like chemotaxis protein